MLVKDFTPKRIKTIGGIARYLAEASSVVRDKSPKNPEKLLTRLLSESVGDKPSRMLEYLPCVLRDIKVPREDMANQLFGFFNAEGNYHTNARELLSWGWTMSELVEVIDFTNYQVFKCEVPYFMYGQVSTHNQLTTVSHSNRYTQSDRGYWMPPEIRGISQATWDRGVSETWRPMELQELMKRNGIVRREVFARGKDMLQMRVFTIGGFTNNPNAWEHFLKQRTDLHTQLETRNFTEQLKGVIKLKG